MKRIHLHWSAGSHKAGASEKEHYHFAIEGNGNVVAGNKKPEANQNTGDGHYVAHTRGANTGAIGVALCAMRGAKESPFDPGPSPITQAQLEAMALLCADLCETYNIPVTRQTVLSHSEVQATLGIKQRGKWDINWIPGMDRPGKPVAVGDLLRQMIKEASHPVKLVVENKKTRPVKKAKKREVSNQTWLAALLVAAGGALLNFGCKLPFMETIFKACGG